MIPLRRALAALCLLAPLLQLPSPPAAAQTAQEIRAHLEREARRERCELYRPVHAYTGPVAGEARPVGIAVYTMEGCGGGNNWGRTVGVFVREGGRLVELSRAPDLRGLPEVVERARVQGGLILVDGMNYGPDDGRCCPSRPGRARLTIRDGILVNAR